MTKYFLNLFATNKPKIKKRITASVVPFPWPNKDPININKKIIVEDKILKWIPNAAPEMKKRKINIVLPNPIPKCDPMNAI